MYVYHFQYTILYTNAPNPHSSMYLHKIWQSLTNSTLGNLLNFINRFFLKIISTAKFYRRTSFLSYIQSNPYLYSGATCISDGIFKTYDLLPGEQHCSTLSERRGAAGRHWRICRRCSSTRAGGQTPTCPRSGFSGGPRTRKSVLKLRFSLEREMCLSPSKRPKST